MHIETAELGLGKHRDSQGMVIELNYISREIIDGESDQSIEKGTITFSKSGRPPFFPKR